MMEITIRFTQQEVLALQQLIHIAVQARGMEVAEAGVVLSKKIKDAADLSAKGEETPKDISMYPRAAE